MSQCWACFPSPLAKRIFLRCVLATEHVGHHETGDRSIVWSDADPLATNLERSSAGESTSYAAVASEIARMVSEKQAAYGDSFGRAHEVMRILYPAGIPADCRDALTVVRVVDKLFRIATDRDAFGESPWRDIAGYALLEVERAARDKL